MALLVLMQDMHFNTSCHSNWQWPETFVLTQQETEMRVHAELQKYID